MPSLSRRCIGIYTFHGFFLLTLHYVKDRAAKIQQKFLPLSVYVHFCPFLSVYAQKLFGNLKKNPYLCTVKQHNDDNGTAPSSRIHFAFKDKPLAPSSARAPRRKPSPGRDRREQPLELFEPLLTPPLCGQYKITPSLHFH